MIHAEATCGRMSRGHKYKRRRREGIGVKPFGVSLLAVFVGLFVGFVLFDFAAILLSGHTAEAGAERVLIRLALVSGGIALIAFVLRRGSR